MQEEVSKARNLQANVDDAVQRLNILELESRLTKLKDDSQRVDFWQNRDTAQTTMKEISKLEARVLPWLKLKTAINDNVEMLNISDEDMKKELSEQLTDLEMQFASLKNELRFNGSYDGYNAIISIHAGAGGTDAQDWANMLLRMYVRWAEKQHFQVSTDEESAGDEAGIKSVTIEINGDFIFGKLKGEDGVHRLVRLSPFNADNLRQTSFAKVEVMPKVDQPNEVEVDDKDIKVDVYRSGGHGGQSVNTTDSAVRITHIPTGITVAIQNERSQLQNKETAMTILRSRLAQMQLTQHAEKISQLKGPNEQAAWGNQIRSYVLHPYKQVKDLRTHYETSDIEKVLDGDIDGLINAYLEANLS